MKFLIIFRNLWYKFLCLFQREEGLEAVALDDFYKYMNIPEDGVFNGITLYDGVLKIGHPNTLYTRVPSSSIRDLIDGLAKVRLEDEISNSYVSSVDNYKIYCSELSNGILLTIESDNVKRVPVFYNDHSLTDSKTTINNLIMYLKIKNIRED